MCALLVCALLVCALLVYALLDRHLRAEDVALVNDLVILLLHRRTLSVGLADDVVQLRNLCCLCVWLRWRVIYNTHTHTHTHTHTRAQTHTHT